MSVKISVIIPVYNAEKYLDKCLSSVVNQTYRDMDIVIVDDATTDGSLSIIDKYLSQKQKIIHVVHHDKNCGLPTARKTGLEHTDGEYVYFLDADDWVEPNLLEALAGQIEKQSKDIVFVGIDRRDDENQVFATFESHKRLYHRLAVTDRALTVHERKKLFNSQFVSFWGRLFRREWILSTDIHFMEGASFDEDDVAALYVLKATSIGYVDEILQHYVFHDNTMSREAVYNPHIKERYECALFVLNEAKRLNLYEQYCEELGYFLIGYCFKMSIAAILSENVIDAKDVEQLVQYKKQFPGLEYNKYYRKGIRRFPRGAFLEHFDSAEEFLDFQFEELRKFYQSNPKRIMELETQLFTSHSSVAFWGAGSEVRALLQIFPDLKKYISFIFDDNMELFGGKIEDIEIVPYPYCLQIETVDKILVPTTRRTIRLFLQLKHQYRLIDLESLLKGRCVYEFK